VYAHLFRMAPYLSDYKNIYKVVDLTDVISQEIEKSTSYRGFASRHLYKLEKPRIERFERSIPYQYNETWLISKNDREILAEYCPNTNIQVVRNGVDTETLYPTNIPRIPNSMVFIGHMGVFHNVDAVTYLVNEILPIVRRTIPDVTLRIIGAAPNQQVQSLTSVPGVEVTGYVEDLNHELNRSAIFVAPMRFCSGVQNKILEAMSAGCPVITTDLVNQGLGAESERDLITADSGNSFAAKIVSLLGDERKRLQLGKNGREFVKSNYSWLDVGERINKIGELRKPNNT